MRFNEIVGLTEETVKTKTKSSSYLDDLDDVLSPKKPDLPSFPNQDEPIDGPEDDNEPAHLPTASRDTTRSRIGQMTPSDTMRDYMNRINPDVGAAEPDLPDTAANELVIRTARDVPSVISRSMQAAGVQSPEWHTVNNLPGFQDRNIRGMGRQMFGLFTSTPIEQIKTIANVEGQGPNTDAELRSVAAWLRDNAEDMGKVEVSHGQAIPGYNPDVKEYRANGIRFHVVRDPMGQYIYAYPDKDARLGGPDRRDRLSDRNTPRLREVSSDLLGRYKTAAGKQASDADKKGDIKKGNKRFSGIVKATKKQFDNDAKKQS